MEVSWPSWGDQVPHVPDKAAAVRHFWPVVETVIILLLQSPDNSQEDSSMTWCCSRAPHVRLMRLLVRWILLYRLLIVGEIIRRQR